MYFLMEDFTIVSSFPFFFQPIGLMAWFVGCLVCTVHVNAGQLDAMGVWKTAWSHDVLIEAHKLWFYSLSLSLISAVWSLFSTKNHGKKKTDVAEKKPGNGNSNSKEKDEKKAKADAVLEKAGSAYGPVMKRIVIDGCDLLIPGSFVGWINAGPVVIGMAMVVSTVLTAQDVWRAQRGA